jgi:hypothetical protein
VNTIARKRIQNRSTVYLRADFNQSKGNRRTDIS